ncbi:MAG: DUF721 domain-containing protein [Candidatus Mariimomonas ferrooxydans]
MQRAGSILKKFINNYGLEAGLTLTRIKNQWIKLVGQNIAIHTSPDLIKGNTLFINVDTPQWMHHLSFFKQDICQKLNPYRITEVRFKLGKLPEAVNISKEINSVSLSEEDLLYIENTVRSVKDDELKERFRGLLANALTLKDRRR